MIELVKKFYFYQNIRFPLLILILSLLPVTLSSIAVLGVKISPILIFFTLLFSILYLLHIRIGDEHRDFEHDNLHHKNRPIQKGLISLTNLEKIDFLVTALFVLLLLFFGLTALILGLFLLVYTYVAKREFFLAKKLRSYFFLYNFINLSQTAFLQILVYIVLAGKIPFSYLIGLHFAFTFIGTAIFEFIRKIHIPGTDGTGKDTYTWYLGFEKAVVFYIVLAFIDLVLFFKITTHFFLNQGLGFFLSIILFFGLLFFAIVNFHKGVLRFNQLMQLSFILAYSIMNMTIYFLGIN